MAFTATMLIAVRFAGCKNIFDSFFMININAIRDQVITLLKELPHSLTYHNVKHTLEVADQSMIIAGEEGITDEQTLLELNIAALYHDTGFLFTYKNHEDKSCEIARKELPQFGLDAKSIGRICEIILATKVPQMPKNILQQIICDADLDYFGRGDFFIISENLHREFLSYKIVQSEKEWKESRIDFMKSHSYFTKSARQKRGPVKQQHLEFLQSHPDL